MTRLETTGIESEVVDDDLEHVGHVLMLEYDDVDPAPVREDARDIDGPTVVVNSSPRSYHLYGLAVRSWDDVVVALEESNASREYVREMTRRGTATLRTGPKRTPSGSIATRAPYPLEVDVGTTEPVEISRPHAARLRQLAEQRDPFDVLWRLECLENGGWPALEPVGEKLAQSRYETRTEGI